jgi:DNA-binding FadR family transcriptional regulator
MELAAHDPAQFALRDSEFHRRLSETTHNPLLILLLDSVHQMMSEVRELIANESGVYERVMPTHIRILESIAAHDRASARKAMREHLDVAFAIQAALAAREKPGPAANQDPCV